MKKVLLSLIFSSLFTFISAAGVSAQPFFGECGTLKCQDGFSEQRFDCTLDPVNNTQECICQCQKMPEVVAPSTNEEIFGTIVPPEGVDKYGSATEGGLTQFLSNIIRIGTVIAGIWVMVNFILAGWTYVSSSGDAKAHSEASNKMTYSIIGIAIIVGAYTLAAIVGLVIFGDAGYILNPTFTGPGGI